MRTMVIVYVFLVFMSCLGQAIPKPSALSFKQIIGPAVDFTLEWTPNIKSKVLDVCVSCNGSSSSWIGIGFSGKNIPGAKMNNSDMVVGYFNDKNDPVVKAMYSNKTVGYPIGPNALNITATALSVNDGVIRMCFSRPFDSGHHIIKNGRRVVWGRGHTVNNSIYYHGSDPHDDSGKTQSHRSDEVPPIDFITGPGKPSFKQVIGPAINFLLEWTPDLKSKELYICASANRSNYSSWIGLGFSGDAIPGSMMNDSDIVVGYFDDQYVPHIKAIYSNTTVGYPGGQNTLDITALELTLWDGRMRMCFLRPFDSGHHRIKDGRRVIWAIGNTSAEGIGYHGSDPQDDSGKTQSHRSDEVPPINFLSGLKAERFQ